MEAPSGVYGTLAGTPARFKVESVSLINQSWYTSPITTKTRKKTIQALTYSDKCNRLHKALYIIYNTSQYRFPSHQPMVGVWGWTLRLAPNALVVVWEIFLQFSIQKGKPNGESLFKLRWYCTCCTGPLAPALDYHSFLKINCLDILRIPLPNDACMPDKKKGPTVPARISPLELYVEFRQQYPLVNIQ